MKVSTDACLLGAWAKNLAPNHCLDIGAGSGVLSLMLAQRYPAALIEAVEIEEDCAQQCATNFANSPWHNRLAVHVGDVLDYQPKNKYNLIVSNPPYFDQAVLSSTQKKQWARHQLTLNLENLMAFAAENISADGNFCLILPSETFFKASLLAKKQNLWLAEKTNIRTLPHKNVSRVLLNFCNKPVDFIENTILIELEPGVHHPDFKNLLQNFYLKF